MITTILKTLDRLSFFAKELINLFKEKLRLSEIRRQQQGNDKLGKEIDDQIKEKQLQKLNEGLGYKADAKSEKPASAKKTTTKKATTKKTTTKKATTKKQPKKQNTK